MNIRPATGLTAWYLRASGFWAITLPWGIRILPEHMRNEELIRHEQVHADQYKRLGATRFLALYLWYQLRYGYLNNPLEIEARKTNTKGITNDTTNKHASRWE